MNWKILVADNIADEGIAVLSSEATVDVKLGLKPKELAGIIGNYDALVVRSEAKVTAEVIEAGERLRVIGRAGIGVENIDLKAATRHGIVVVNAPAGNVVSTAEQTLAATRPTAVNLFWALERMKSAVLLSDSDDVSALTDLLVGEANRILNEDRETCRQIGLHGANLLQDGDVVLTHCNAGGLATLYLVKLR